MQIISWQFAVFVIVTLAVYYLLPRKSQNIWLLAASLGFLLTWNVFSVVTLLVSISINYFTGNRIWQNGVKKRGWFWFGVIVNVATLIFVLF
jgi:alginate O-acetyltransferase complex protein AlgI